MKKLSLLILPLFFFISCQDRDYEADSAATIDTESTSPIEELEDSSQEIPENNRDTYVDEGVAFYKSGQYELAKEKLHQALEGSLKEYSRNVVLTLLGNIYNELYQMDSSIIYHKKAIELDSSYVTSWVNLGISYRQSAKYDSAEYCYIKANELDPNDPELHASLGALYIGKGNAKNAITHLEKAIELDPSLAVSHSNYALALAMDGKFDEADKEVKLAVALGYKNGELIKERINSLREIED